MGLAHQWCGVLSWALCAIFLVWLPAEAKAEDGAEAEVEEDGDEAGQSSSSETETEAESGATSHSKPRESAASESEPSLEQSAKAADGKQSPAAVGAAPESDRPDPEPGLYPFDSKPRARQNGKYSPDWAEHPFSINGLIPTWESSGRSLERLQVYLGSSHVQLGLGRGVTLGIRPIPYPSGAPNLHVRVQLLARAELFVSLRTEAMVLLPGAGNSFVSSNFKSRINNWNRPYLVLPITAAASWQPLKWLQLNQSLTLLGVFGLGEPSVRLTLGYVLTVEFVPHPRHGFLIHVGEVGFWDHDFVMVGASYRLNYRAFEARLGYLYRRSLDGGQGAPVFAVGFRF